jgi:Domain of unknown function (DUF4157)
MYMPGYCRRSRNHFAALNTPGFNQKSQSLFFAPLVQPKLTLNQPNDVYEEEADRTADKVMRTPINEPAFFSSQNHFESGVQLKCKDCEDEEKLDRKESSSKPAEANSNVSSFIGSLSSKGSPLPESTKGFFEPRFGYDFSNVKIHDDADAAKSAQSINALAYTTGNNIVFNQNQFSPESESGKKLLAHELAHVIQQKGQSQSVQLKDGPDNNNAPSHNWENDMESFSKVAAEHYLFADRKVLFDSVKTANCKADSTLGRECKIITTMGTKVTVLWQTDTRKAVVKADIGGQRISCGYDYTLTGTGVKFTRIKCWLS